MRLGDLPRAVPAFPIALTFAWIVGLFSASTAPLHDLWRPLILGVAIATFLVAAVVLVGRGDRRLTLVASCAWLVALGAWFIAAAIAIVAAWRFLVDRSRTMAGRPAVREPAAAQVTRVANALGWAGVLVAVVTLASSGVLSTSGEPRADALPDASAPPSIYLVLLDGYPATDTLKRDFGFDNSPFLGELEARGFDVPDRSRSNYNRTLLTLTSMLNLAYIHEIPEVRTPGDSFASQTRQLTASINGSAVPKLLRERGYRIVSVRSTYGEATLSSADEVRFGGALTLFEEQLLRYTTLGRWMVGVAPELIAEQHRAGVRDSLKDLASLPMEASNGPSFVLAHVFSPHTPLLFNRDGSPRPVQACYPETCALTSPQADRLGLTKAEYGVGLAEQILFLNAELLRVVDAIAAEDPDAVVVLFSDHGARFEGQIDNEHFETFLAARTPGHDGLLSEEMAMIDVLPVILNAYFGAELALREYQAWWGTDLAPLELTPADEAEAGASR